MDQRNFTGDYDMLLELIRTRTSVRKLKPDPIPDDCVTKVLEAGRWAMSGANGQPWDFIVVRDPAIKKELFLAYSQENQRIHLLDGAAARFQAAPSAPIR